ncbi:MAG: M23 family metallopeptidase [Thermodesulfobacteriota bacterium]
MGELNLVKPINVPEGSKKNHKYGSRGGKYHGIDYPASTGTQVKASEDGKVLRASFNEGGGYGNVIVIYHNPGDPGSGKTKGKYFYTLYAHLDKMYVKAGDYVEKYETVGAVGNTGTSTGPHLHFEVIEANTELSWKPTGSTGVPGGGDIRKDPNDYYSKRREVAGTLPDMVERAVIDRIDFKPDIDLKRRDSFRVERPHRPAGERQGRLIIMGETKGIIVK